MPKRALALLVLGMLLLAGGGCRAAEEAPTQAPATATATLQPQLVTVVRVVDGDTIVIEGGQRVRYIGIDTPESTTQRECYGKEASAKNVELVLGQQVHLEKDVSETDRYGRLLRYVYVGDTMVNAELVRLGYAQAATFPPDVKYAGLFVALQREARDASLGLWGACGLDARPGPLVTLAPALPACATTGDRDCNCSDFATWQEAQDFYDAAGLGDPHRLDSDQNGIACETLPGAPP